MTNVARVVLADCEEALNEIVDGVQGSAWRRRWINAVVLLRVVGHVLEKIDTQRSEAHKLAIEKAWTSLQNSKPEPSIFWEFIEQERNSILKEYRLSAGQGVTVRVPGISLNLATGEQRVDPSLPTLYHYSINEGPYIGRDQRDVLREAIAWWKRYLDEIDASVQPPGA